MNRIILYTGIMLTVVLMSTECFSQTRQNGGVYLINSGKQAVGGVQVMASGSAPVTSDQAGKFTLAFPKRQDGEMLMLNGIYKSDYEVVNEEVVKQWVISSKRDLVIELCRMSELYAARMKYYDIGRSNSLAQYNKATEDIEALKSKNMIDVSEYQAKIEAVTADYRRTMELLDEYSLKLARINKDNLDETERRAMEAVENGNVAEAIEIFRRAGAYESFIALSGSRDKVQEQMDQMVISLKQYADMCMFAGGGDNFKKADEILLSIAMSDTTNYDYCKDYAEFCNTMIDLDKSILWTMRSLRAARNDLQVVEAKSNLFTLNVYSRNLTNVDKDFEDLTKQLDRISVDQQFKNEALTSIYSAYRSGLLMQDNKERAEKASNGALIAVQRLYKSDSVKYKLHYGIVLSEYASVMTEKKDFERALKYCRESISVFEKIRGANKLEADFWRASTMNLEISILTEMNMYKEALVCSVRTMTLITEQYDMHPVKYAGLYQSATVATASLLFDLGEKEIAVQTLMNSFEPYLKSGIKAYYDTYINGLFIMLGFAQQAGVQVPDEYYNRTIELLQEQLSWGKFAYKPHDRLVMVSLMKIMSVMPSATMTEFFSKPQLANAQSLEQTKQIEPQITAAVKILNEVLAEGYLIDISQVDLLSYYAYVTYQVHGVSSADKKSNVLALIDVHKKLSVKYPEHKDCYTDELLNMIDNVKK